MRSPPFDMYVTFSCGTLSEYQCSRKYYGRVLHMATELQSYAGLQTVVSFLAISLPIACDSLIVYFIRSPIVERNNRDV